MTRARNGGGEPWTRLRRVAQNKTRPSQAKCSPYSTRPGGPRQDLAQRALSVTEGPAPCIEALQQHEIEDVEGKPGRVGLQGHSSR